ncbi:hypothetical protein [Chryseobacterium sp. Bi04]|uniref:hypothetical protein n=1 Tax=Chryseobacterium sp. Bi04 TaxID=2822345 RepID=UPI001DF3463C|nr:hypothetical protein [Chryseobacterium sp. Bi04]CAH0216872.1 hypothetical protein SRABI04_02375 [Chryseobacterium sp. Bi04]
MNSFFQSIGLYTSKNIEINVNIAELNKGLRKITYTTNTTFISLISDSAIPTRFEYRGIVNEKNFTIKRRRHLFDINLNYPVIKGSLYDQNTITTVSLTYIPSPFQIFTFILLLCFFIAAVAVNVKNGGQHLPFIAVSSLMTGTQYFVLKREIIKGKHDFERELSSISQEYSSVVH